MGPTTLPPVANAPIHHGDVEGAPQPEGSSVEGQSNTVEALSLANKNKQPKSNKAA